MTYDKNHALLGTRIPGLPAPKSGKVRDVFDLGGYTVETIFCPGHTKGSMSFLFEKERILLTGDACNPRTLIIDPASLGLTGYERALKTLKEKVSGRYDYVLISHGIGQTASRSMVEEALQIIGDIRTGRADNIPLHLRAWRAGEAVPCHAA